MQIAIHPVEFDAPGGPSGLPGMLTDLARATEAAGCSQLLLMDHLLQIPPVGDPTDPMLEGYTTAAFLAGRTERIGLGLLVTGVTYRHPALLVKIVTTLDVLSGGRAVLGIGAAWYEDEHDALGFPFPPVAERFEHLEDTLRIAHQMWSDDDGPLTGTHHRLDATICRPRPAQAPHPPIWIGGGGERKTLRLVAEYADACNVMGSDVDEVAHKMEVLDGHCADVGRDPGDVARTVMLPTDPFADPAGPVAQLRGLAEVGIDTTVLVPPPGGDQIAFVERVGEQIVPAVAVDG